MRADSPQAAEQGYTQLWRETSAVIWSLVKDRDQFSAELSCEQDRTGQFESGRVKPGLAGSSQQQGDCSPALRAREGAPRGAAGAGGRGRCSAPAQEGLLSRRGKVDRFFSVLSHCC